MFGKRNRLQYQSSLTLLTDAKELVLVNGAVRLTALLLFGIVSLFGRISAAQAGTIDFSTEEKSMSAVYKSQDQKEPKQLTADELWKRILLVVELPEGYVTRKEVERIFGVTLKLDQEYLEKFHEQLYTYKSEYLHINYETKSETESLFMFEWGQRLDERPISFPLPPTGMCIDANKIMPSISQRGWALRHETRELPDAPYGNVYRKGGRGILRMAFSRKDNCLLNLNISAANFADQLIR